MYRSNLHHVFWTAFGEPCKPSEIIVNQSKTGRVIEQKPEFQVTVTNKCSCPQFNVVVKCFGLSSIEPVDSNVIKKIDDVRCVLNNGKPIAPGLNVEFKYAWATPQDFPVGSCRTLVKRLLRYRMQLEL
ncbi:uncharacterized protein A4U43_C02F11530 [Asparagus officinalis]|uniref:Uncharacterized protein n=1 Tax=Asparagus officinalis TaxID=4686 RepID=A0A5P1FLM4_ASPOF|nr:uncharacterized protein A4U43_C02F11530 [Asparagus officinalis]